MQDILMSLFAGAVVGILFGVLKLPIPAPPVLSGVMGIVGVWGGGTLVSMYLAGTFG